MENEVKVEEGTTSQSVQQVQPQMSGSPVEPVKTKKKGHGPLYWIIVIIGVGIIVYLSIGIGEKLGKIVESESGNNKTEANEKSNSNVGSNSNSVQELDKEDAKKYVEPYVYFFDVLNEKGLTDKTKVDITFKSKYENMSGVKTAIECKDAFDDCDEYGLHSVDGFNFEKEKATQYQYDNVNSFYKQIFGTKNNVPKLDSNPSIFAYLKYSNKLNAWVELEPAFGGSCIGGEDIYYVIDSAEVVDNKLVINLTYFEYTAVCESTYSEEELAKMEYTEEDGYGYFYKLDGVEKKVLTEKEIPDLVIKNHDKLPKLTFTFEKENDNYILISVTK